MCVLELSWVVLYVWWYGIAPYYYLNTPPQSHITKISINYTSDHARSWEEIMRWLVRGYKKIVRRERSRMSLDWVRVHEWIEWIWMLSVDHTINVACCCCCCFATTEVLIITILMLPKHWLLVDVAATEACIDWPFFSLPKRVEYWHLCCRSTTDYFSHYRSELRLYWHLCCRNTTDGYMLPKAFEYEYTCYRRHENWERIECENWVRLTD